MVTLMDGWVCSVPGTRHGLSHGRGSEVRDWQARGVRLRVHPGVLPARGGVHALQRHSRHVVRILSPTAHLWSHLAMSILFQIPISL